MQCLIVGVTTASPCVHQLLFFAASFISSHILLSRVNPIILPALIFFLSLTQLSPLPPLLILFLPFSFSSFSHSHSLSFILVLSYSGLLSVPAFKALTGLPPYLGMLAALGVLWTLTDAIHAGEGASCAVCVCVFGQSLST